MHKPVTSKGRARQQAMIEAAHSLFLQNGYEGTTLDQVIARAGGSRRMLYECFGDKGGLFRAVVEQATSKLMGQVDLASLLELAPDEALYELASSWLGMLLSDYHISLYRLLVSEAPRFPEPALDFYQQGPVRLRQLIAQYLAEQDHVGRLHVPDPARSARLFFGLIRGDHKMRALLAPAMAPTREEIASDVQAGVELFLKGHRPTSAAGS